MTAVYLKDGRVAMAEHYSLQAIEKLGLAAQSHGYRLPLKVDICGKSVMIQAADIDVQKTRDRAPKSA